MTDNLPHNWEMSPRYRILDSAGRRFEFSGETQWQLHLIKQPSWNYTFLWLCPLERNDDTGFIWLDSRFSRPRLFTANEKLSGLEETFKRTLKNDWLARRFVLNTRGQLREGNQRMHDILTVRRDGVAAWDRPQYNTETLFRWRENSLSAAKFIEFPAAQIWEELQNALQNPDSEANFARQFARFTPQQRGERVQRPTHGTLDKLNRLLHDIMLASPQWSDLHDDSELYLSVEKSGETAMYEIGRGNPSELETPDFVRQNVRQLWNYFQPFGRTIAKFLCVQSSGVDSLFARAFRPSAHEQLEAYLRLRQWMKAH